MKIIILSILCGILLLISFILLIQNYKLKKDARALTESIDEFTNQGKTMQISLWDNDFARLQNAVGDLEELVNLEKASCITKTRKTFNLYPTYRTSLKLRLRRSGFTAKWTLQAVKTHTHKRNLN